MNIDNKNEIFSLSNYYDKLDNNKLKSISSK